MHPFNTFIKAEDVRHMVVFHRLHRLIMNVRRATADPRQRYTVVSTPFKFSWANTCIGLSSLIASGRQRFQLMYANQPYVLVAYDGTEKIEAHSRQTDTMPGIASRLLFRGRKDAKRASLGSAILLCQAESESFP